MFGYSRKERNFLQMVGEVFSEINHRNREQEKAEVVEQVKAAAPGPVLEFNDSFLCRQCEVRLTDGELDNPDLIYLAERICNHCYYGLGIGYQSKPEPEPKVQHCTRCKITLTARELDSCEGLGERGNQICYFCLEEVSDKGQPLESKVFRCSEPRPVACWCCDQSKLCNQCSIKP